MGILTRGEHQLPHQSQLTRRDLHAEKIRRHLGGSCFAYRQSTDQLAEAAAEGRHAYEYLVRSPESASLSFAAFSTWAELCTWADAYGCYIDREPAPGEQFTVRLPLFGDDMAPLIEAPAPPFMVTSIDVQVCLPFSDGRSYRYGPHAPEADALNLAKLWVGPNAPQVTLTAHSAELDTWANRHLTYKAGAVSDSGWRCWVADQFIGAPPACTCPVLQGLRMLHEDCPAHGWQFERGAMVQAVQS